MRGAVKEARTTGHGLGLNNVLQLTKVLGLTMTVRSRLKRGTVFSVLLPIAESALIAATSQQNEKNEQDA
jgi:signal transduction histidine kinase